MFGEYNSKLSKVTCNGTEVRPPAGCAIVAAAQIFAHLEPPMTVKKDDNTTVAINWPYLKQTQDIQYYREGYDKIEMVAYLMKHIFMGSKASPECPQLPNGNYDLQTAASTANVEAFMRQYINIDNSQPFDARVCKASLDNLKLVMAAGSRQTTGQKGSHAWVVDGYAVCQKGTVNGNNGSTEIVNRYDLYLHCNMGYGTRDNFFADGGQSGWFLVGNDWSVTFQIFNNNPNPWHYNISLTCSPNACRK